MYLRIFLLSVVVFLASCSGKKKQKDTDTVETDPGNNFSMRDFVRDQWKMNQGIPHTLLKVVTKGGHSDSSFVSGAEVGIGEIMLTFVNTDIGADKFKGKYNVSLVDDDMSDTKTFYYEANENDLYTRSLQVNIEAYTGRIRYVYVEAVGKKGMHRKMLKLYYAPRRIIQIQEHNETQNGSTEDIKTEYHFLNA